MFQESEKKEYYSQQAPKELKNRTWSSIQLEKRKVARRRRQAMMMAACIAGAVLISNVVFQNSTIVRINDMPISYLNVEVGDDTVTTLAMISEERNKELQRIIPLEIDVEKNAHIKVSEGSISKESESMSLTNDIKELDIQGNSVIFWYIRGDSNTIAMCTITTEEKEYQYVMEKVGENWKIRLKETK